MDTCLDLIALQYTCMIVMAMLAFFVFVSRYYVTCRNRQFEQSRWMIVVALLLFVVHYMCQMRLGWRQQGNDVGVLFNLLFYSPSAILLSWSQLNILRAGHRRWSFMRYGVVGYALMVLCIVAGVISNGSLHIGPMLYVADAIHFFTLLYYTWAPLRELGNVQRRLDSEHGNPADAYLRTMRFGFFVVCASVVVGGYDAFVVNNINVTNQEINDKIIGVIAIGPIVKGPQGAECVRWNTKEKKWESKWTRSDVSSVSMIPAVSIKSEMVFVCGWNDASGWEVTGLDWKSGATRHRSILGKNNRANGAYAIIQYLANGDLLFNSVAGPIRVKY